MEDKTTYDSSDGRVRREERAVHVVLRQLRTGRQQFLHQIAHLLMLIEEALVAAALARHGAVSAAMT